jgi:hypothetical protein
MSESVFSRLFPAETESERQERTTPALRVSAGFLIDCLKTLADRFGDEGSIILQPNVDDPLREEAIALLGSTNLIDSFVVERDESRLGVLAGQRVARVVFLPSQPFMELIEKIRTAAWERDRATFAANRSMLTELRLADSRASIGLPGQTTATLQGPLEGPTT